jgi:hypothetical protein
LALGHLALDIFDDLPESGIHQCSFQNFSLHPLYFVLSPAPSTAPNPPAIAPATLGVLGVIFMTSPPSHAIY